jgi:hypothetical protein
LIDAYVGVDFSIVYKVTISVDLAGLSKRTIQGQAEHYCKVPNSGIDPQFGRKYQPQPFLISPDSLTAPPGQKIPKFKFSG